MGNLEAVSWKEFKISELFGKAKLGKYHSPETLWLDSNGYEYICASNQNNGINKDMPMVNGNNLQLTSSNIIAWGKQCPMFTWHKNPCVTSQGMYYLELGDLDERVALFVASVLTHVCSGSFNYSNCLVGSKMDEIKVFLPAKEDETPNWAYMAERIKELEAERIKELEAERIKELEAYLLATGLENYELTEEDKQVLAEQPCLKDFKIGDLFDVDNTWVYGKNKQYVTVLSNKTINSIAVVSGITVNNGVNYYTEDMLDKSEIFYDCLTISTRGEYSGTVTYHNEPFVLANNILAMPMPNVCREAKLFIGACINKLGYGGYSNYPRKETLKNNVLLLPVKEDNTVDWGYMERYVRVTEKLVIADAVKWKDKMIEATKSVVA